MAATVVVVGAGLAGMRAALAAARAGAHVTIIAKRAGPAGGVSGQAQGASAVLGRPDGGTETDHAADTIEGGHGLPDPSLVAAFVADAGPRLRELEALGARFSRDTEGLIRQVRMPGHRYPRSISSGTNLGAEITTALASAVARTPGIEMRDGVSAVRLVVNQGEVRGIIVRDEQTGEVQGIAAGSVVIASGGLLDLFRPRAFPAPDLSADGYAIALLAGAELVDMEFTQFFPTALIWPAAVAPLIWVGALRYDCDAHLLDADGGRFMDRYDPVSMELATRDVVTRAIVTEVRAGRGTPHGGVWMSVEHVAPERVGAFLRDTFPRGIVGGHDLRAAGVDLARDRIEVGPIAHFQMGGIRIDSFGATSVPGLFAAGEVAGGLHGANRIEDNAVGEALVFGARAGAAAAEHACDASAASLAMPRVRAVAVPAWVGETTCDLCAAVVTALGPVRTGRELASAAAAIADVRAELDRRWPPDVVAPAEAARLRAAVLTAGVMVAAAVRREESRGSHYRLDHPTEGGASWARSLVVHDDGTGPIVQEPTAPSGLPPRADS